MISLRGTRKQLSGYRVFLCWLLLSVAFRAAIPAGFMPGTAVGSDLYSWFVLCYGNSGSAELLEIAEHGKHDHLEHSDHAPAPQSTSHELCLFAAASPNGLAAQEITLALPPEQAHLTNFSRPSFFSEPLRGLHLARAPPAQVRLIA